MVNDHANWLRENYRHDDDYDYVNDHVNDYDDDDDYVAIMLIISRYLSWWLCYDYNHVND